MLHIKELSVMDIPQDVDVFMKKFGKSFTSIYGGWELNPQLDTPDRLAEQVAWMIQNEGSSPVMCKRVVGRYRRRCHEIEDHQIKEVYTQRLLS